MLARPQTHASAQGEAGSRTALRASGKVGSEALPFPGAAEPGPGSRARQASSLRQHAGKAGSRTALRASGKVGSAALPFPGAAEPGPGSRLARSQTHASAPGEAGSRTALRASGKVASEMPPFPGAAKPSPGSRLAKPQTYAGAPGKAGSRTALRASGKWEGELSALQGRRSRPSPPRPVHLQRRDEGFLRDLHLAELAHPLLALFLLVEELALAGDVAAIAFGGDVLAQGRDGFAGDDLAADGGLDRDLEHMARDQVLQLLAHGAAAHSARGGGPAWRARPPARH